ncbi:MAG: DUF4364 family protein [Clostridia bacterium]|nr:DUF4364 family protein [Clostridia bacterium]
MAKKLKLQNDVKIFILYLLKNVGKPLYFNDLTEVVLADGYVDYMAFAECLADLSDTGNVLCTATPDGDLYEITEQGVAVAAELESKIAAYIRTQSLKSALRFLSFKERGIRVPVTSTKLDDGRYEMIFEITEKGAPLFSLSMTVDNSYMEQKMRYNFQNDPERIYRAILSVISGDSSFALKQ